MRDRIQIVDGDITELPLDAIVNAANGSLLGGGGVDGAIHRAAGPELLDACSALGGCPTGEAKITKGFRLPAEWVIHTVGPVWSGGGRGEAELLAGCYKSSFGLVAQHGIKTVAFPAISAGAYGYPMDQAALVAVTETSRFLQNDTSVERVIFVCFNQHAHEAYTGALNEVMPGQ